jgi:dTDP-4-amino-4,6-dideoxygalactose transaminase
MILDNRDKLREFLLKRGIGTAIHYPIPIHLQPAAKFLGYKLGDFLKTELQSKKILTLPINENLNIRQIYYIARCVNNFFI